jgi:hypothetical protein
VTRRDIIAGASLARHRVNLPFSIVKTRTGYRVCCCRIRGSLEISRSVRSGEKPKIAEVNLLGLTGDLDGTLTPRVVKTIETCSPKSSRQGQSTEEEAVDSNTAPTMHWASLQQKASCSSPSDQQAAAPLTKGDLLIVAFVSSLWLWAATWALTSAALR